MDVMKDVMKMMLNSGNLGQIGQVLGVDEQSASSAIQEIVPTLLQGMQGQAKNKDTQEGFLQALIDHSSDDTSDFTKFLSNVDTEDGAKIVKHLLGNQAEEVAAKAQKKSGIDAKTVMKIMAIAAPFLMSQMGKSAKTAKASSGSGDMLGVVTGLMDGIDAKDVLNIVKLLKK